MRWLSSTLSSLLPGFVFWEIAGLRKLAGIFLMAFMFVLPMQGAVRGQTLVPDPDDPSILGSRKPLILIHGRCGSQEATWHDLRSFFNLRDDLRAAYKLYYFNYPTGGLGCPNENTNHTWERVQQLAADLKSKIKSEIDDQVGSQPQVAFLTHSLGGLIARSYMQEQVGYGRTLVLITLATPHHGTLIANNADLIGDEFSALYWDHYVYENEPPNDWLRCLNGYAYNQGNGQCGGGGLATRRAVIPKTVVVGLDDDEVVRIDSALFENANHDDPTLRLRRRYRGFACGYPDHSTIHEFGCVVTEQPASGAGEEAVFSIVERELLEALTGDVVTTLQNNVAISGLSGASGSQRHFRIVVPPNQTLAVTISGGSGDADLYVRWERPPTLSDWNCRPYIGGNNETCSFPTPSSGDWYVMLHGYTAYSGVTLRANYTARPVCTYSISPTSQPFGSSGGSGSVSVTAPSGCSRTATSNVSWITITSGSSGSGNGTVTISVAGNTSTTSRTGTLTIAGKTFTVTQAAATCTYSISPTSQSFGSSGGSGSVSITATAGCSRTAISNASWITVTSGSGGSGSGTVTYSVAANTSTSQRSGTITIQGNIFTVTQAGATSAVTGLQNDVPVSNLSGAQGSQRHYRISVPSGVTSLVVTTTGGSGDVDLYVKQGTQASLSSYDCRPYLGGNNETCTFTNPVSGNWYIMLHGYGSYSGVTLRAKYTVGPVCSYSISPTNISVGANGVSGSVSVNSSSGCGWTATSNASWITITSGSSGTGSGTVSYSVAANTSTSSRTGTLTIAGKTFTVTQAGATSIVTALQNDVPLSNLSGGVGNQRYFKISVPAGKPSLVVTISGGSGDADLYVRRGQQPTLSVYDCSPYIGGNNETCSFTNPASGDWYIMLNGYSAYSGVTLRGAY